MFALRKPTDEQIRAALAAQAKQGFTYAAVGATATQPPAGYAVDHTRIKLGEGQQVFRAAKAALERWEHFHLGWVEVFDPTTPLEPERTVAILARVFGVWTLNTCRILYVVDESSAPVQKFGFAYGTLPDHAESGEERFTVEWHENDDSVWYDSRPNQLLVRLGYPVVRRLQERFARDSTAAMSRAVGDQSR